MYERDGRGIYEKEYNIKIRYINHSIYILSGIFNNNYKTNK